jgi:hypothetical protein
MSKYNYKELTADAFCSLFLPLFQTSISYPNRPWFQLHFTISFVFIFLFLGLMNNRLQLCSLCRKLVICFPLRKSHWELFNWQLPPKWLDGAMTIVLAVVWVGFYEHLIPHLTESHKTDKYWVKKEIWERNKAVWESTEYNKNNILPALAICYQNIQNYLSDISYLEWEREFNRA